MADRQEILDEQDLRTLEHIGMSAVRKLEKSIERAAKDATISSEKKHDHVANATDSREREVKHSAKIAAKTFTKSVSLKRDWGKDTGTKEWEKEY